jgi:hypothetical protein
VLFRSRRRERQPAAVEHTVRVPLERRADLRDDAVVHAHVEDGVDALDRVDHARSRDHQVFSGRVVADEHHATSWIAVVVFTATGPCVNRS